MTRTWKRWPKEFARWLLGSPFRRLPPAFGNTVPPDLAAFEAQADEGAHHGIGGVARQAPTSHAKTKPARVDPTLERQ